MLSLKKKMLMAGGARVRPQDVFATSLYTGNGGTQTITNGLDLAGKGGLAWFKRRGAVDNHRLYDTIRGRLAFLSSSLTDGEIASGSDSLTSFNANGFSLGADSGNWVNIAGSAYVAWSFRRAKKFFDIVTYTGNGVAGRQIPHGLGDVPGMIVVKRRDGAASWCVYHRSLPATYSMFLNTTAASAADTAIFPSAPSSSAFTVGAGGGVNLAGATYVAYLFAQNPDLIDCGSYVATGNSGPAITCGKGWAPQFVMMKQATGNGGNWYMVDTARGILSPGLDKALQANTSNSENTGNRFLDLTATGFQPNSNVGDLNNSGETQIYLAIRSPT